MNLPNTSAAPPAGAAGESEPLAFGNSSVPGLVPPPARRPAGWVGLMENSETRSLGGKGCLRSRGLEGDESISEQLNDQGGTFDFLLEKRESLAVDFPNLSQKQNLASKAKQNNPKSRAPSESRSCSFSSPIRHLSQLPPRQEKQVCILKAQLYYRRATH